MTSRDVIRAAAADYFCMKLDVQKCGVCRGCIMAANLRAIADRIDDERTRARKYRQAHGVAAWPVQDCIERIDDELINTPGDEHVPEFKGGMDFGPKAETQSLGYERKSK